MVSHRVGRLSEEIQKQVAEIIAREIKDPRLAFLSVVAVDISTDGSYAKIYVSPMVGTDHSKTEIIAALHSASGYIRRGLSNRLRTRAIPELSFQVDESIAYGVRMHQIIDQQIHWDEQAAAGRPELDKDIYKE